MTRRAFYVQTAKFTEPATALPLLTSPLNIKSQSGPHLSTDKHAPLLQICLRQKKECAARPTHHCSHIGRRPNSSAPPCNIIPIKLARWTQLTPHHDEPSSVRLLMTCIVDFPTSIVPSECPCLYITYESLALMHTYVPW